MDGKDLKYENHNKFRQFLKLIDLLKRLLERVFPFTITLFIILVGLRFYEYKMAPNDFFGDPVLPLYFFKGTLIDLLVSCIITSVLYLFQLPFFYFSRSKKIYLFHILALFTLNVNFTLIEFFLIANEPLNESIFFLSFEELRLISGSGNRFTFGVISILVSILFFYFFIGKIISKIKLSGRLNILYPFILIISLFLIPFSNFTSEENQVETLFVNNRLASFTRSTSHYFLQKTSKANLKNNTVNDFKELNSSFYGGKKLTNEFPLMYELADKSEFAQLFKKNKKGLPNIVFIIVESLSTSLVGDRADKTGHIMPFLDSLITKSLYFPNFLSTCDRTHNVLPATLSSVPNAPNGNMFMQMEYPLHWSLISLLKKHYFSRFFCGVDLNYSNMNGFMNSQQTSYLVNNWNKYTGNNPTNSKNSWGHPDGEIFEKSWEDYRVQSLEKQPRLDVFLTISTHDPFIIPNQRIYTQRVLNKIKKYPRLSATLLDVKQQAEKFATYTYLDDELKKYFDKAKKMSDFDNTLFFIFGDHGNHLCIYDELERFKIPLIIYSPLLKKAQTYQSVSTHLDLTPTIVNFLRTQYQLPLPQKVPFIGKELSLVKKYECKRSLPFGNVNLQNSCVLNKNYYLYSDLLFRVNKGLEIKKIDNKKIYGHLKKQLILYNNMSEFVCYKNKIIPKPLYCSYTQNEVFETIYRFTKKSLSKEEKSVNFISIGKDLVLKQKTKYVRIKLTFDAFLKKKIDIHSIPLFTTALMNKMNGNEEFVFWKQSSLQLIDAFKANDWNKFEISMVFRMNNYKKLVKDNYLRYYLFNSNKKEWIIQNFKTIISTDPVKLKSSY